MTQIQGAGGGERGYARNARREEGCGYIVVDDMFNSFWPSTLPAIFHSSIEYLGDAPLRKSICTDAQRCPGRAQHDLSPSITARVPALDENVYFE